MPVPLDELHYRGIVGIAVHHFAAARVFGNGDHRNARPVTEKVDWLEEARVPIAATLVESNKESGVLKEVRMRLKPVDDAINHCFEKIEFRARRVAVIKAVRLQIRD